MPLVEDQLGVHAKIRPSMAAKQKEPDVAVHSCSLRTLEARDYPMLLASLVYTVRFRPARIT